MQPGKEGEPLHTDRDVVLPIHRSEVTYPLTIDEIFDGRIGAGIALQRRTQSPGTSRLSYAHEYAGYRKRLWSPAYAAEVDPLGRAVQAKAAALDTRPDVWVAMPTRAEDTTAQAVQAVLDASGEATPMIIVFHNYHEAPTQRTQEDLALLENHPNVFLMERRVPATEVIGDIRGFVTDVALTAASLSGSADPIILSADADICRYSPNAIERMLQRFRNAIRKEKKDKKRKPLDGAVLGFHPDLETLRPDSTTFTDYLVRESFAGVVSRIVDREVEKRVGTGGAATFLRGSALCATGGHFPVSLGEDLSVGQAIRLFRNDDDTVLDAADIGAVYYDPREELGEHGREGHYRNWEQERNNMKPDIVSSGVLDRERIGQRLAKEYADNIRSAFQFLRERGDNQAELIDVTAQLLVELYTDIFSTSDAELQVRETQDALLRKYLPYQPARIRTPRETRPAVSRILDEIGPLRRI